MNMSIQITKRDCQLLYWINRCGFVTIHHIVQQLHIKPITAYQRLHKLVEHDYLAYRRITIDPGVYCVTRKGVQIAESPLPPLSKVALASYRHHLCTVSLLLRLEQHLNVPYVTERELRHQHGQKSFGLNTHISDGDILLDNQRIAIEVELNKKSQYRRDKIFLHYLKSPEYKQVWYFYENNEVRNQMERYTKEAHWLRLYDLKDILQHPEKMNVSTA
jgi:hypothetical protein